MSTLAIVLIAVAAVLVLLFAGGLVVARRRVRRPGLAEEIAKADRALESARAADRGWDRELLEAAVRSALGEAHPEEQWHTLDLVLVDDRPGVEHDRAHVVAVGVSKSVRVVLKRDSEGRWSAERLDEPVAR